MEIFFQVLPKKNKCLSCEDCMAIFAELFSESSNITYMKANLELVLTHAFSWDVSFQQKSPASWIYFGSHVKKLIFASFYLFKQQSKRAIPQPSWEDLLDTRFLKSNPHLLDRVNLLPKYLSKEEIQNPTTFLTSFFYRKSLKKWCKLWNVIVEFSIGNTSLKEYDEYDELESRCFLGLLEACYLLYVRDFQQNEMNNEDNQD